MTIEEFIRHIRRQITEACNEVGARSPESVGLVIKLNGLGQVCQLNEFCASIVEMEIYLLGEGCS